MPRILPLLFFLLAANLRAQQTLPIWIWPEGEHLYLLDTLGNRQIIGTFPITEKYDPKTSPIKHAHVSFTDLAQQGEEWHLVCSNGDAVYYLHSTDNGTHWTTEEVDHMRNYKLQVYDYNTDTLQGLSKGPTFVGYGGVDIALDPMGQPHLAYTVSGGNYYYDSFAIYAHRERGRWVTEKVLTARGYPKRYLGYIALDVDDQLVPHVLVHSHEQVNTTQHSLSLFSKRGGQWTRQVVSERNTGSPCMEFAIDSKGGYHAVATADNVAYYWYSGDGGKTWKEDPLNSGNCRYDLVLDSLDQPHIAGSCYSAGIYYGERIGGGALSVHSLEARPQMCHAKAVVTPEGESWAAFISHYYGDVEMVVHKRKEGVWVREVILVTLGNRGSGVQPLVAFVNRKPPKVASPPPLAYDARPIQQQDTLEVTTQEVEISVYDYQRIDGDTVSVSVNGKWVLEKVALTRKAQGTRVVLTPGENSIVLYAWNEGRVPPNTAILQVRSGPEVKTSTLKSTLAQNAGVTLIYKAE